MDGIFELSIRLQRSRNVFLKIAGNLLYLIPRLYVKNLERCSSSEENLEEEMKRRQSAGLEEILSQHNKRQQRTDRPIG